MPTSVSLTDYKRVMTSTRAASWWYFNFSKMRRNKCQHSSNQPSSHSPHRNWLTRTLWTISDVTKFRVCRRTEQSPSRAVCRVVQMIVRWSGGTTSDVIGWRACRVIEIRRRIHGDRTRVLRWTNFNAADDLVCAVAVSGREAAGIVLRHSSGHWRRISEGLGISWSFRTLRFRCLTSQTKQPIDLFTFMRGIVHDHTSRTMQP